MHHRNNLEQAVFCDRLPEGTQVGLQHNLGPDEYSYCHSMLPLNYPRLLLPQQQRIGYFMF